MPALADSIPQSYSPAPLLKRRRHRSLKGRLHSDLLVRPVGLPLVRKSSCQVSGPSQPAGRRAVGRSGGLAGGRAVGRSGGRSSVRVGHVPHFSCRLDSGFAEACSP